MRITTTTTIILSLLVGVNAIDVSLSQSEENILFSHIRTPFALDDFYRKILKSNSIDDPELIENFITENDLAASNLEHKCFNSTHYLLRAFDIQSTGMNDSLPTEDVRRVLPSLVQIKFNDGCRRSVGRATWKNILIGFLAVTLINCSAFGGAVIYPFRKKPAFKWILSTFIGLAVGTLTGSGIFHLIPMAFNIPHLDIYHSYLTKALLTMIVIYLFYVRDQLLKIFLNVDTIVCTHSHGHGDPSVEDKPESRIVTNGFSKNKHVNGLMHNLKTMKAAGWMIFIGDMLHNFIDGLTLGAAFTVSIGEGLRMTLPILCEEFPHELGDLAVLLSSGLSIGQALLVNFLAACSCYLGFFVGAKLGELEEFHPWIYALAGGMFVYIGLTDMVPELVSMGEEIKRDYVTSKKTVTTLLKLKIFLCQNSGVLFGLAIMYVLGRYGERLENLVQF